MASPRTATHLALILLMAIGCSSRSQPKSGASYPAPWVTVPVASRAADEPVVTDKLLDVLLAHYKELGLPLPPADAKLVRIRRTGQRRESGWQEQSIYALAFLLNETDGRPSKFLVGTLEWAPGDAIHKVTQVEPNPESADGIDVVFRTPLVQINFGLATAIQCKARGWNDLAKYLAEATLRYPLPGDSIINSFSEPPWLSPFGPLEYFAFAHWTNQWVERRSKRAEIVEQLKPLLNSAKYQGFVRSLELASVPSGAKPGSVAAMIDDLINLESSRWHYYWDNPKYARLVEMGFDAVPALIESLDDQRGTICLSLSVATPPRLLLVHELVFEILEGLAGRNYVLANLKGVYYGTKEMKDGFKTWWADAQKEGERSFVFRELTPGDADPPWPRKSLLRIAVKKYPEDLAKLYQDIQAKWPIMDTDEIADGLAASSLPCERKVDLFRAAAKHKNEDIRKVAIKELRQLGIDP